MFVDLPDWVNVKADHRSGRGLLSREASRTDLQTTLAPSVSDAPKKRALP